MDTRSESDDTDFIYIDTDNSIEKKPPSFPLCSKPYDQFIFNNNQNHNPNQSAHTTTIVKKINKDTTSYLFKYLDCQNRNDPEKLMACLEAVVAAFYKALAGDLVPSTHAIYNHEGFVGLTSKMFDKFESNSANGLKLEDLIIEYDTNNPDASRNTDQLRNAICKLQENLAAELKKRYSFSNWLNATQEGMTASKLHALLIKFDTQAKQWPGLYLKKLEKNIAGRLNHLKNINRKDPEQEKLLKNVIANIKNVLKYRCVELELIDQYVKDHYPYYNNFNDTAVLTGVIYYPNYNINYTFTITKKNIENYRIQKNQGIGLILRFLFFAGDLHNRNLAKKGEIIDFDFDFLPILWFYRLNSRMDAFFYEFNEETFKLLILILRNFPFIENTNCRYWPTKKTILNGSHLSNTYQHIPYITLENFFTEKDYEHYKELNNCDTFMFHFHVTLLKFLLTSDQLFFEIAKLHVPLTSLFKETGGNLIKALIDTIIARKAETKAVCFELDEFHEFLTLYGDFAFDLIIKDMQCQRNKYQEKCRTKPYFNNIANSINLAEVAQNYKNILGEWNVQHGGKAQTENANPTLQPHRPSISMTRQ